jgi:hypothetical protein
MAIAPVGGLMVNYTERVHDLAIDFAALALEART